jgi:hypothetical protein
MDENPYKAPEDGSFTHRLPILRVVALSSGIGCGLVFLALVVAFFTFPLFVDIRENPRYWDELHARQKAEREAEKAAKNPAPNL